MLHSASLRVALLALMIVGSSLAFSPRASAQLNIVDLGTLPGHIASFALGLNEAGEIVGTSQDGGTSSRPFLWVNGAMTDLGTLGGSFGWAADVNDFGQIAGTSSNATGSSRAFVWEDGVMTDLDIGESAVATGVNNAGQIVGWFTNSDGQSHAFLWDSGTVTELNGQGGSAMATAINQAGTVVGAIMDGGGHWHPAVWRNTTAAGLGLLPGDSDGFANDINDAGQIVGQSRNSNELHAVLWDEGAPTQLRSLRSSVSEAEGINATGAIVGASNTPDLIGHPVRWNPGPTDLGALYLGGMARDINNGGMVVGSSYTRSGYDHAVLWISVPDYSPTLSIRDLGALPGYPWSAAIATNDAGQVVGYSTTYDGNSRAFLWEDGVMIDLGSFVGGQAAADDVNGTGSVVGWSTNATGVRHPFLWEDGVMTDLGGLPGYGEGGATGINDAGQVVGWARAAPDGYAHAFLWENGMTTDLGTPEGWVSSGAVAINEAGLVVGTAGDDDGNPTAVLWKNGTWTSLANVSDGTPMDVNGAGEIAGYSGGTHGGLRSAFLWEAGDVTNLGHLGGYDAVASGINDASQIVGGSIDASGDLHAFLWESGRMNVLADFGFGGSASDVSNMGQVVGTGSLSSQGPYHAVLWNVPPAVHDVAITSASARPPLSEVGRVVGIMAIVQNQGTRPESFNVSAFAGSILVGTILVDHLAAGAFASLPFAWDTSGLDPGSYVIRIEATPVANETNISDNEFEDGTIVLYLPVDAEAKASPVTTDVGYPISFACGTIDGTPPFQFSWDFGDGTTGQGNETSHTYDLPGTKVATCAVMDGSGSLAMSSIPILINSRPSVIAAVDQPSANPGTELTFSSTTEGGSGDLAYHWEFGDGLSAEGPLVTHAYSSIGEYTAIVTVQDSIGAATSDSVTVQVSAAYVSPTAQASATPSATDVGFEIRFTCAATDGTSPYDFAWDFGDGSGASTAVATHAFAAPGTKTVTCTVTDGSGGHALSEITVVVSSLPSVLAAVDRLAVAPDVSLTYSAAALRGSGGYTYIWHFGDGLSTEGQTVTHAYASPGAYVAVVTVRDDVGGTASGSIAVTVSRLLVSASLSGAAASPYTPITFTGYASGGSGGYTYSWSLGDGSIAEGDTVSHAYGSPAEYTTVLIARDAAGTTASTSLGLTISFVVANVTVSTTSADVGETITFAASASGGGGRPYTIHWDFGDGAHAAGAIVSHAYTTSGSFVPKVTITDANGASEEFGFGTISVGSPRNPSATIPESSSIPVWAAGVVVVLAAVGAAIAVVLGRRKLQRP